MKTLNSILITVAVGLLIATSAARADTFLLTSDHCTGGCGTPPFGTITLTQNGTSVNVSVSLNNGARFVETGAGDDMYFKFNISGFNPLTNIITVTQNVAGIVLGSAMGAFNGDGTGNFSFGINCTSGVNCGTGGSNALPVGTVLMFSVANATLAQLETANNLGNIFVADILASNGNTGPVDASVPSVPDGGTTLMLLGSALSGLGLARRFFWR